MSYNNEPFKAGATDPFMGYVAPGDEAPKAWVAEHLRSGGVPTITDDDYSLPIFGGESSDNQSNPLWTMADLLNHNASENVTINNDETDEDMIDPAEGQSVKNKGTKAGSKAGADKGSRAQSSKSGAAEGSKARENTARRPKRQTRKQHRRPKRAARPAQFCETCNAEIPSRRAHWARRCYKCDIDGLYRRDNDLTRFQMG